MTNNEIRTYLEAKNIKPENVTKDEILKLRKILKEKLKGLNIHNGKIKLSRMKNNSFKFIRLNIEEVGNREAISFNEDGFIGIAGWASVENLKPFISSLIEWSNSIRKI